MYTVSSSSMIGTIAEKSEYASQVKSQTSYALDCVL